MKTEVVKYTTNSAEIAKMSAIYLNLTITDIENKDEFDAVHSAKMIMVTHRTDTDKLRKKANANAQEFIKTNNKNAANLVALMKPIEDHLVVEEKKVTDEQKRIKAEEERLEKIKTDGRVTALFAVGVNIPYLEAAMLSDEEYTAWLDIATNDYNTERLRLQEEQKTRDEAAAKLAADQAEIARIQAKQEANAKAQAEAEKAIEIKLKAIEDEKKAAIERLERIKKAIIQAKKDAAEAEKIRVSKEKAEAAEMVRLEALKPDKELLVDFANRIIEIKHPVFENIQCQNIADNARVELLRISNDVIKQVKEI